MVRKINCEQLVSFSRFIFIVTQERMSCCGHMNSVTLKYFALREYSEYVKHLDEG